MAVADDLKQLSAEEVLYLTLTRWAVPPPDLNLGQGVMLAQGPMVVYRGRLRQALSGNWVFDTSVGTNGVTALLLGAVAGTWASTDTPAGGLHVTITDTWGSVDISAVIPKDLEA